ncbi:nitrate reductase molybdenum cofactor assembly chaperone [Arsenicicoccus piscis]|uniref:Nitrate reductase molybdenum cofactor assembly chaperone n=1 Tax=Arsenicicoccus piscis TaxID=673954 RepID=A0ABQ6HV91_9MICO|nr:nitrate reductase molybdenum cofactor assembly chaperone [Arsenicicoccus piscis]MCH8627578.1 nitrate reductase molybdenum cofactor assembly chaperone [Arsenicicoccus piscis]GMA18061.1 hypothetical protein GCM10025862_00820 [Arsenicicoccus piscis]GMA21931.1 hypothetical protein GCM10025862_39520 [Arsenicicoccus piscis]
MISLPLLRRHRSAALPLTTDQTQAAWQCVSLLLGYPDDELHGRLPAIRSVAEQLPEAVGAPILRLVGALEEEDPERLRVVYVETFDYTRRCAPYLTYFAHGDTRKRGLALVQIKQAYRRAGVELADGELPDHLSVVLEFGATASLEGGMRLLLDHRAGVEVLRMALQDKGSRWADALVALSATLPPLDGDEKEAVARLIAAGPPEEEVGLDPYSIDPTLDAHLNPRPSADADLDELLSRQGNRS